MMQTAELIKKYQLHEKDTGSTVIQIILLSEEIEKLKLHSSSAQNEKENKKDIPAKRALLKKNSKRKILYQYLIRQYPEIFQKLQEEHNLSKFLGIKEKTS